MSQPIQEDTQDNNLVPAEEQKPLVPESSVPQANTPPAPSSSGGPGTVQPNTPHTLPPP